ncbi:MAG TPA: type II toxin-antitoxin system VapC family toxin [Sphingomonas sp.]
MIFVDTNVLIDLLNPDERWFGWSRDHMIAFAGETDLVANTIVLAELASNFKSLDSLYAALERYDVEVLTIDDGAAFAAGQAFREYRRRTKARDAMLSDFLIGAHARHLGATLLTRDASLYRTYFPDLTLITPETHP